MSKLPYAGTQTQVKNSVEKIKEMLTDKAKCLQILEVTSEGQTKLFANKDGLQYVFEVDLEHVAKRLQQASGRRGKITESQMEQAARVGWRIIFYQVKELVVSVQYGFQAMHQAFGGRLITMDEGGAGYKYVGEAIDLAMKDGRIKSGNFISALLPERTGDNQ